MIASRLVGGADTRGVVGVDPRFAGPCVVVSGLVRDKPHDALIDELVVLRLMAFVATACRTGVPPHKPSTLGAHTRKRLGVELEAIEPPLVALRHAMARAAAHGLDA